MAIKLADTARPNNYVDSEHLGTYPVAYAEDVWFADGTRLSEKDFSGGDIQKTELPLASEDELGNIYQFIGVTGTYINGYWYKCIETPDSDPTTYEWEQVPYAWDVQLTQAEYDALPNGKKTDNKTYYVIDGEADDTVVYGWTIDPDESDSFDCVTYADDAIGMSPANMGATSFNYGSWEDAFFMPRPCMLKLDGTVDYYLNPNDYSLKEQLNVIIRNNLVNKDYFSEDKTLLNQWFSTFAHLQDYYGHDYEPANYSQSIENELLQKAEYIYADTTFFLIRILLNLFIPSHFRQQYRY